MTPLPTSRRRRVTSSRSRADLGAQGVFAVVTLMLLDTATHAPASGSCDLTYHELGPLTCWSAPVKPAAVQAARAAVTVDPTSFGTTLQLGVGAGVGVGLGVAVGVGVGTGVGAGVAVGGGVGPDLPAGVAVAVARGGSGLAPSVVAVPSGVARSVDVGTELGFLGRDRIAGRGHRR